MERRQSAPEGRDERQELERVQMELRRVRAVLTSVKSAEGPLKSAVEEAAAQRDLAASRLAALQKDRTALLLHLRTLAERVASKEAEDKVLARGARRQATPHVQPWLTTESMLRVVVPFVLFLAYVLYVGLSKKP